MLRRAGMLKTASFRLFAAKCAAFKPAIAAKRIEFLIPLRQKA